MTRQDGSKATQADVPAEGLRQRKQRETRQRIVDAGLGLFIQNGYEATTLDDIAAAAGISRRSFFHYFKSKDDILLSLQAGFGQMIVGRLLAGPRDIRPLAAIREAVLEICALIPTDDMIVIDRLMRSSETVQARKQAGYIEQEKLLFEALQRGWPSPQRETGLRLAAMMAMGAIRLATETFNQEGGRRPLPDLLRENFAALEAEV